MAVDALMPKFFEEIRPDLPSEQISPLIDHSGQFWVVYERRIELNALHVDPVDRRTSAVALCPGKHITDP